MSLEYSAIKALNIDLRMKKGEEGIFIIPLFDPDDSDDPLDLSGYTSFTLDAKYWPERTDYHFQLTSGDTEIEVQGANNNELKITVSVAKGNTKSGYFYYNLYTNTNEILLTGKLYIDQ